jgi:hypothetical protein
VQSRQAWLNRYAEMQHIFYKDKENFLYSGDKAAFYCTNGENELMETE